MGRTDPLTRDALETVLGQGDLVPEQPGAAIPPPGLPPAPPPLDADPSVVADLITRDQASVAALERTLSGQRGPAALDLIEADLAVLRQRLVDPRSHQIVMAGIEASWWLNEQVQAWLGEENAADPLTRAAPHDVTAEMGVALSEVADVIRPHPEVVACLSEAQDHDLWDGLARRAGGHESARALRGFLDTYGARGAGEIDLTRPRWCERPTTLLPILLTHIRCSGPGAGAELQRRGETVARDAASALLVRLRALPDGPEKADRAADMIARLRAFIGYREYPKFGIVQRYRRYKEVIMAEARRLADVGAFTDPEDAFYLTFEELQAATRSDRVDLESVRERKAAFKRDQALAPPRVLTSEGECLNGVYRRSGLPPDALLGLPISAGVVEGRARVLLRPDDAHLEVGDILVTRYTDPSWTPLFVALRGLVTEVGGLMTHGAVIAREYGLPAVVGVVDATRRIQDGQRIRVHGAAGYVELLPADGPG